ncbi:MAG: hypothetical protein ABI426_11545 [Flavobacterium sp.]
MEEFKNKPVKLDIGEQINDAFEIFKKVAVTGGLAMLSIYITIFMLFVIGMGFFFKADDVQMAMKNFKPETFTFNGQMIYLGAIVIFSALISPFMAGLIKMARDADNNEEVQFTSIFAYVNSPQFIDIILATTTLTVVSTGSNMLLKYYIIDSVATFLGALISLLIVALTYLVIPHIIFGKLDFIKAIGRSASQILANFFPAILLMAIAFILAIVGVFAFCIGILFTMPLIYIMHYCIYKKLNTDT